MHTGFPVLYRYVDGAHMFTSRDPTLKGLLVMHAHPEVAFNEVTKQINFLLKRRGWKGDCRPVLPYSEFKTWLDQAIGRPRSRIQTIPAARIQLEFEPQDGKAAA